MRTRLVAAVLVASLFVPGVAHAGSQFDDLVMQPRYYVELATCETNLNWDHSTLSYTGGFGIYRQTFARWSSRSPKRGARGLSPREQAVIADRIAWVGYTRADGEYVYPVGPWGWGCVKMRKKLQRMICASRDKRVQRWKRDC